MGPAASDLVYNQLVVTSWLFSLHQPSARVIGVCYDVWIHIPYILKPSSQELKEIYVFSTSISSSFQFCCISGSNECQHRAAKVVMNKAQVTVNTFCTASQGIGKASTMAVSSSSKRFECRGLENVFKQNASFLGILGNMINSVQATYEYNMLDCRKQKISSSHFSMIIVILLFLQT